MNLTFLRGFYYCFPDLKNCTMNRNAFDYYQVLRNKFGTWNCKCFLAPSLLALPPEMAFQRATGGMPVHITVHRGPAKQLAHLHAAFTLQDPSARSFIIALRLHYRMIVSMYAEADYSFHRSIQLCKNR